uniref:C2H2-type domain-containing protein n=1 Tax=Moschus moschiferus TaxID=68415 RepID=A0A8C6CXJ2_MOSMO
LYLSKRMFFGGCGHTYTTVFNLQSHTLSFHEEQRPFVYEPAGCGKTFAMKQSLSRHAVVRDPDKKKIKVRLSREKQSLASRLSGYLPPKRTQGLAVKCCLYWLLKCVTPKAKSSRPILGL